jgi:predicted ester cyclase
MTKSPLEIVKAMELALQNDDRDLSPFFHEDFLWSANFGCGEKLGLQNFERNWMDPFRAAFGDRDFRTDHFMQDGDWAACFGNCHATHRGELMGIAPTGKRITIPYIDFWRIDDEKIVENRVSVDYASVLKQLGHDVFNGQGWEAYDRGDSVAPSDKERAGS